MRVVHYPGTSAKREPIKAPTDAFPECPQAFVFSCVFSARPALTKKYEKNVKKSVKKNFYFAY
ncbi:hypothetical protein DW884_15830 [Ruminococcus sp. AM40-10AC]|nr:hypothetical protein DWW20_19535 [Ruminococcus sp. AF14-5]RHT06629.1 hypothetical protein DW884_15830 [Ruminococcus sp. AM40-10AC]